jgi:hypothetical protein
MPEHVANLTRLKYRCKLHRKQNFANPSKVAETIFATFRGDRLDASLVQVFRGLVALNRCSEPGEKPTTTNRANARENSALPLTCVPMGATYDRTCIVYTPSTPASPAS